MTKSNRRSFLKRAPAAAAAAAAVSLPAVAQAQTAADKPTKKVHYLDDKRPANPRFNSVVSYGNLVFLSGIGAHVPGDIKSHTKIVLDEMQQQLERVGSSMEKVLKVNVYLNDLRTTTG